MLLGSEYSSLHNDSNNHNDSIEAQYKLLLSRHQTLAAAFQTTQTRSKRTLEKYNQFKLILADSISTAINELYLVYKATAGNLTSNINNNSTNELLTSSSHSLSNNNLRRSSYNVSSHSVLTPSLSSEGINIINNNVASPNQALSRTNSNTDITPNRNVAGNNRNSILPQPVIIPSSVYSNYTASLNSLTMNNYNPIPSPASSAPQSPALRGALITSSVQQFPHHSPIIRSESHDNIPIDPMQRTQSQPVINAINSPRQSLPVLPSSRTIPANNSILPQSSPMHTPTLISSPRMSSVSLATTNLSSNVSNSSTSNNSSISNILLPNNIAIDFSVAQSNFRAVAQFAAPLLLLIHQPKNAAAGAANHSTDIFDISIRDLIHQTNLSRSDKENLILFCQKLRAEAGVHDHNHLNNVPNPPQANNLSVQALAESLLLLQSQLIDANKRVHNTEHQLNNYRQSLTDFSGKNNSLQAQLHTINTELKRVNELYSSSCTRENQLESEIKREVQRAAYYKNIILMCNIPVNSKGQVSQEYIQKMHIFSNSPYAALNNSNNSNAPNLSNTSNSFLSTLFGKLIVISALIFASSWKRLLFWIMKQWYWLNSYNSNNPMTNVAKQAASKTVKKLTGIENY
jgi:hypothetical protein